MKNLLMSLPIILLCALLLFGSEIASWVRITRVKYESYQNATSMTNNCIVIGGVIYDKKGRKQ